MEKICNFIDTEKDNKDNIIFSFALLFHQRGEKAVIYTNNEERAEYLDRFLWIYKQESFIPHKIFKYKEEDALESVAIVTEELNPIAAKKIILDSPPSIDFALSFNEIVDFVEHSTPKDLKESRERFKKFREEGYLMKYEKNA